MWPDVRRGSPDLAGVPDRRSPVLIVGPSFIGILVLQAQSKGRRPSVGHSCGDTQMMPRGGHFPAVATYSRPLFGTPPSAGLLSTVLRPSIRIGILRTRPVRSMADVAEVQVWLAAVAGVADAAEYVAGFHHLSDLHDRTSLRT